MALFESYERRIDQINAALRRLQLFRKMQVISMQMHSRSTRTEKQLRSRLRMRQLKARQSLKRLMKLKRLRQRKLLSNLAV